MNILLVVAFAILLVMALALLRAVLGPSLYDRVLAVNVFGTKTVLIICVIAQLAGRPSYLDIALVYALINFISVIALLKFIERSDLQQRPAKAAEKSS